MSNLHEKRSRRSAMLRLPEDLTFTRLPDPIGIHRVRQQLEATSASPEAIDGFLGDAVALVQQQGVVDATRSLKNIFGPNLIDDHFGSVPEARKVARDYFTSYHDMLRLAQGVIKDGNESYREAIGPALKGNPTNSLALSVAAAEVAAQRLTAGDNAEQVGARFAKAILPLEGAYFQGAVDTFVVQVPEFHHPQPSPEVVQMKIDVFKGANTDEQLDPGQYDAFRASLARSYFLSIAGLPKKAAPKL